MTNDKDVFNESQDPENQGGNDDTENSQDTSGQDPFTDQLSGIKNEDGTPKYSDVASALNSIPHAQEHISVIETENATLKSDLAKAQAAKEILEKAGTTTVQQTLDPDKLLEVVNIALDAKTASDVKTANVRTVRDKFSDLYGEKAQAEMTALAEKAGLPVAQIKTLAEVSPQAVFRMAGIDATEKAPVRKTPGVNQGDNFTPPRSQEKPKSIMGGSNTSDMLTAWRGAGERASQ